MMLQEEMQKGIKVIGEQYSDIQDNISGINKKLERLERIEDNIELIKLSLRQKADLVDLEALEKRVVVLEKKES